jgi:hypothetical protein
MKRPISFAAIAFATAFTILSAAQQKKPAAPAPKKPAAAPAKPALASDDEAGAPLAGREEKTQPAAARGSADAGVVEQKTLDGGARVFRFGEVEVEGRLKSPQIVYFLRRVRAEFAAGDLGHRSFMREMSETRNEPVF